MRSSNSSMGEEEESSELSEGLREGELLSPCSTDRELGRSSSDCRLREEEEERGNEWGGGEAGCGLSERVFYSVWCSGNRVIWPFDETKDSWRVSHTSSQINSGP